MSKPASPSKASWHPLAALAGWVVPGLGHVLLGERSRGLVLGICILLLWLAGALIGGLSVFDRALHPAWFLGQMLVAPSVAVDQVIQTQIDKRRLLPPISSADPAPPYEPSFGKVHEQGVLYTALAGLLNLLAIIDVVYRDERQRSAEPASSPTIAGGATP